MNKFLIKALRCLANQDENGDCNMDRYNFLRKENEPRMYCNTKVWNGSTIRCPYHQEKYETCFEDGECGGWLSEVADILESHNANVEKLKERLRKYEESNTPHFEDVRLTVLAHGKKYISIEDLLKVIDEIFEVDKNAE